MKILSILCAIVATSVLSERASYAQSLGDVIPKENRHHNFGSVPRAGKLEHRFELFNPFKTDLHLQGARSSCGCTTPVLHEFVIKPGQSVPLIAQFNADNLQLTGQKRATVTVRFSSPIAAELQLNVEGYIRTDVVLSPGLADFGKMAIGDTKKISLELQYAGRSDWKIERIVSPFSFIAADFQEISRSGGQVRYRIQVQIDEHAPDGYFENLLVAHTNDVNRTSFPVRVTATIEKPLQFSPAKVVLRDVKPSEQIDQFLVIEREGTFELRNITSDIADIRFERPTTLSRAYPLVVGIQPRLDNNAVDNRIVGSILIHTDIRDEPFKIPFGVQFETEKLAEAK